MPCISKFPFEYLQEKKSFLCDILHFGLILIWKMKTTLCELQSKFLDGIQTYPSAPNLHPSTTKCIFLLFSFHISCSSFGSHSHHKRFNFLVWLKQSLVQLLCLTFNRQSHITGICKKLLSKYVMNINSRVSQFFQIAMKIKGDVVEFIWVGC